jgi:putative transposase
MPNFRRYFVPGGTYFFTLITDGRRPIFDHPEARKLLIAVIHRCRQRWPFTIDAAVLLPDHMHTIWSLPPGDDRYSLRIAWLKKEFTKAWISSDGDERFQSRGRTNDGRRGVWQPKFWEHTIKDDADFERHIDYVHWNPVKHGHARCPREWRWSSFRRWMNRGVYPQNWGCGSKPPGLDGIDETTGE